MLTDASFDTGGLWWKICAGREPLLLQGGAGLQSSGKAAEWRHLRFLLCENRQETADLSTPLLFALYQGTTLVVP
jgi:hypothetical protein